MLTDSALQDVADRHAKWRNATGSGKAWYAARLAKEDVPALLRHIQELAAERDAAVAALQGTEQVA